MLLAGPPGCGKTSAAHALAAHFGWEVVELNASDARNATAIRRVAGLGAVHQTFSSTGEYQSSKRGQHKLIILDEADNLYERASDAVTEAGDLSDRGGKRAILDTIEATQQPIILIANDAYAVTRGSERLARMILKVPFRRLSAPTVRKILKEAAAAEAVSVSDDVLHFLATRSEGDLRSALNDLEALSAGRSRVDTVVGLELAERNRGETAFEAVAAILKGTEMTGAVAAARDLDEPPDFLLAWLDENVATEYRDPRELERAYQRLSRADVFLGRTMRRQQFGLWGYATEVMAGGVAAAKAHRYETPPHYRFPGWIRHMGQTKGSRGARDRLAAKLGRLLHESQDQVVQAHLPPLRILCGRDQALAESVSLRCDLEEDEIRFLLGPKAADAYVEEVVAHVERRKAEPSRVQTELTPHPVSTGESPKASRHRGTRLGDF